MLIKSLQIQTGKYGSTRQSQQGVALLTILLLVVAITVVAGSMVASQKISIRQYDLLKTQDQILQDVRAGESLAAALIAADSKVNMNDSLLDAWAQPLPTTAYGQHNITLHIQDAAGRFNLNNLYHNGSVDVVAVDIFKRLLVQLGLEPELAYAVVDWQDPDFETSAEGGAEIDAYKNIGGLAGSNVSSSGSGGQITSTLITISNQPFISTEEIMSVRGFNSEKFKKLQPYITAVPYYLPINVNTASPLLLSALFKEAQLEALDQFHKQIQVTPATNIEEALEQQPWSSISKEELGKLKPMLDVRSHAFKVLIDVAVEDTGKNKGNDNNQRSHKHRYATTTISKIDLNQSVQQDSQAGGEEAKVEDSKQKQPDIADNSKLRIGVFGTRLLTYHPVF